MKKIFEKYKWLIVIILVLIIAYPFICLFINKITSLNLGELYTFDLSLKEFMPIWVAFWGIIGAAIGIWQMQRRIIIQEKQNEKQDNLREEQRQQFDTQINRQDEQIQIQQKQLRDNHFSAGVELLGNQNESARIGGAYNLYFLVNEFPDEYLTPTCEILCAHIRNITSEKDYQEKHKEKPSNEIQTIINLLFQEDEDGKLIFNDCKKNLDAIFLCGVDFNCKKISNTRFGNSVIKDVDFSGSKLFNVSFSWAKINDTTFNVALLTNVLFNSTTLNKAMFNDAKLYKVEFVNQVAMTDVCFVDAKIDASQFNGVFTNVQFNGAKFNDSTNDGDVDFIGTLTNVCFYKAQLKYVGFDYAILNTVDFSDAILKSSSFSGTVLENYINEITRKGYSLELTEAKEKNIEREETKQRKSNKS